VDFAYASSVHSVPGHYPRFLVFHFPEKVERKKAIPSYAGRNVLVGVLVEESFTSQPVNIRTGIAFPDEYLGIPYLYSIVAGSTHSRESQTSGNCILTVVTDRVHSCHNSWMTSEDIPFGQSFPQSHVVFFLKIF
jgi:hypothetical protein